MFGIIKFTAAFVVVSVGLSIISVAWPRLTSRNRPVFLNIISDVVRQTPFGEKTSSVLGISRENKVKQIDLTDVMNGIINSATDSIANRAKTVIITQSWRQIVNLYDSLSPDEKRLMQDYICSPSAETK